MEIVAASGTGTACLDIYTKFIIGAGLSDPELRDMLVNSRRETLDAVLIRSANDAQKIGEAYLAKCVEQLKSLGLIECRRYTLGASSKYHVIGKKGL